MSLGSKYMLHMLNSVLQLFRISLACIKNIYYSFIVQYIKVGKPSIKLLVGSTKLKPLYDSDFELALDTPKKMFIRIIF